MTLDEAIAALNTIRGKQGGNCPFGLPGWTIAVVRQAAGDSAEPVDTVVVLAGEASAAVQIGGRPEDSIGGPRDRGIGILAARSCRICGCTDNDPCSLPCCWSPLPGDDVCIHCFVFRMEIQKYIIRVQNRSLWDLHAEDVCRRVLGEPGLFRWMAEPLAPIPTRCPAEDRGPLDAELLDDGLDAAAAQGYEV